MGTAEIPPEAVDLTKGGIVQGNLFLSGTSKLVIGASTLPVSGQGRLFIHGDNADDTDGPHIHITTDSDVYPLMAYWHQQHGSQVIAFDAYRSGGGWLSSYGTSNFAIARTSSRLSFYSSDAVPAGDNINWDTGFSIDSNGNPRVHGTKPLEFETGTEYIARDATNILAFHAAGYCRVGSSTTSHGLASDGSLLCTVLEVDSQIFADYQIVLAANGQFWIGDISALGSEIRANATYDEIVWGIGSNYGRQLVICEANLGGRDFGHAIQPTSTVFVQSAADPLSVTDEWWSIAFDGTNAIYNLGSGAHKFTNGSIELDSTEAVYWGDANTNGSWRRIRSGNDLLDQRREAGTWVTKSTVSA